MEGDLVHDITTNNPPEPTPFDKAQEAISLLDVEASAWFDGAPIENEGQAADVARILDSARKLKKEADEARKIEKRPHDEAADAVQAKWKPVLADADRIAECAKAAQTQWLIKLEAQKRAEEAEARRIAEEKIEAARKLAAEVDGSLAAAKARDDAVKEAQRAERELSRATHDKAGAKGAGMARTVSLRTSYRAQVDDRRALLNHIATRDPEALTEFVEDWAAKAVRAGARAIPGVTVLEDRSAA